MTRPEFPTEGFADKPTPWRYRIRVYGVKEGQTNSLTSNTILGIDERGTYCVEQHQTVDAYRTIPRLGFRHFRCLDPVDQKFADELAMLIQQACEYFYFPDEAEERPAKPISWMGATSDSVVVPAYVPMEGIADVMVTDAEVLERVEALDKGENTREASRSGKQRYPLTELPFDQQRALIEQVEACKKRWSFSWIGEVERSLPTDDGPVSL